MVSAAEKLIAVGGRRVSHHSDFASIAWHADILNTDVLKQTEAIISIEESLEKEKKAQVKFHEENQKHFRSLEDKIDALYNAVFKKDGEVITEELGNISLENKVDALFIRVKQQQDANDEHKRIMKKEFDELKDERIKSLEERVERVVNYLKWHLKKQEKSWFWW